MRNNHPNYHNIVEQSLRALIAVALTVIIVGGTLFLVKLIAGEVCP